MRTWVGSLVKGAIGALSAALVLGAFPGSARARADTAFDLAGHDWEGCADFVALARAQVGAAQVVATRRLDFGNLQREDAVVLVHPVRTLDVESLGRFMRAGGRVVLLDDFGSGEGLLSRFGIERVPLPDRPRAMLRGNPALAIADAVGPHPVVANVSRVMLNHATGLKHPDLSVVLVVRSGAPPFEERAGGVSLDVPVGIAGTVGQGRLFVLGDGSVIINEMLHYEGNQALARGLVLYAVDDDTWGKRNGRLFVLSGDFEQQGAFGGDGEGPREADRSWNARERALKDALAEVRERGLGPVPLYVLAVLAGLGVVAWVGAQAGRTHRPTSPRYVRPVPLVAQGGLAGHAAVIGGAHTGRALAMLEWKAALEEALADALRLDARRAGGAEPVRRPGAEALMISLGEGPEGHQLLAADELRALRTLLLRMAEIETMVLSAREAPPGLTPPGNRRRRVRDGVRDAEVLETAALSERLIASAFSRAHSRRGAAGLAGQEAGR